MSNKSDKCIAIRTKYETVCKLGSLYDAVRWCWKAKLDRAMQVDYVLAVINKGDLVYRVEAVFKPTEWHRVTAKE
jgi:hypothetical protein